MQSKMPMRFTLRFASWIGLVGLLAACATTAPSRSLQSAEARTCKTTRNVQAPGPQPPQHPPRCVDSLDAGKLPGSAIAPIVLPY